MYLRSYWYVAAWSDELPVAEPIARIMLGEPVVLYRRSDGTPVALEDRCVHRRAPLSIGRVIGDTIRCGYHGLVYDPDGACVKIPGQTTIPQSAKLRRYPAADRHGCIWVWMGAAEAADPAAIPDFRWLATPGWAVCKRHARVACHYQLIVDNLLDLSHLAFVHSSTVGTEDLADKAEVKTERIGEDRLRVSRWTLDVLAARTYAEFGNYTGNIDRWQISEFQPPSTLTIDNGSAAAGTGAPEGRRGAQRWGFRVCHGITPETERTTNYFWALAHEFGAEDAAVRGEFHRQSLHVVGEDIAVFEAQQKIIELDPAAPTLDIRYDAGPLQARRIVERLLAREAGNAAARGAA
jgi:phenylpropionate dioxygenase-like ring-hydroxylating dioxygenase large terminal subunit